MNIAVIGATGSVGSAVMRVCASYPERLHVKSLAAYHNSDKLRELGAKFHAATYAYEEAGEGCLERIAQDDDVEHIVFVSSGTAAIKALCTALKAGKTVSLANKESIVVAGQWVMPLVRDMDQLRPVDSEHNAIWQCLHGEHKDFIRKIYLTASGGPFRIYSYEQMSQVFPDQALNHPVWNMGAKITIDSANLMNKGIELIEAMYLFGLAPEQVDALISPGSFVHGLVEFEDGSVKLLAAEPDMSLPAASCLFWPERHFPFKDFKRPKLSYREVSFEEIDISRFPAIRLAREVMRLGGAYPAFLVGADEVAVEAFLTKYIRFTDIAELVEEVLNKCDLPAPTSLDEAIEYVNIARIRAKELV